MKRSIVYDLLILFIVFSLNTMQ